jgi:hypothetical protein
VGLTDEFVLSVDPTSEDNSISFIHALAKKLSSIARFKVIESIWDLNNISRNGVEFSIQTNKAISECSGDTILCLQSDEAVHEKDFDTIRGDVRRMDEEGFVGSSMMRIYFYGDINTVRTDWTVPIVRLFKKGKVVSCGDAMNSEVLNGGRILKSKAHIYHYSRIGDPQVLSNRIRFLDSLFHPAKSLVGEKDVKPYDFETYNFDCYNNPEIDVGREKINRSVLLKYYGTHPIPFIDYKGEP